MKFQPGKAIAAIKFKWQGLEILLLAVAWRVEKDWLK
jgi:hypothetical protein